MLPSGGNRRKQNVTHAPIAPRTAVIRPQKNAAMVTTKRQMNGAIRRTSGSSFISKDMAIAAQMQKGIPRSKLVRKDLSPGGISSHVARTARTGRGHKLIDQIEPIDFVEASRDLRRRKLASIEKSEDDVDYETRCKWEDLCAKVEIEEHYDRFVALRVLIEGMLKAKQDLLFRRRSANKASNVPTKIRWQA